MDLTFSCFLKLPLILHTPFISVHFPYLLNVRHIPHFCYCSCIWRLISDNGSGTAQDETGRTNGRWNDEQNVSADNIFELLDQPSLNSPFLWTFHYMS